MSGSWLSALAIITRRFMPPDSSMMGVRRFSQSERSWSSCSIWSGAARLPNKPRLKRTVSSTVAKISSAISCGTSPIIARAARYSVMMSCPSTSIRPEVIETKPQMMLMSVVLPAPLGPSNANISPFSTARSIS